MQVNLLRIGAIAMLSLALSACGGSSNDDGGGGVVTPPPPPAASFQSKFGASFEGAFDAGNTTDPKDPAASDVPALNSTADPLDN